MEAGLGNCRYRGHDHQSPPSHHVLQVAKCFQIPHPCWDTTWGHMRTLFMLWNLIQVQCETLLLTLNHCAGSSGVLVTPGQYNLGGEDAHTWPAQAQPGSFYCLWLPNRWWLAVPSLSPDAPEILRLWVYIKACIWMERNRLSNQKEPVLHWLAKTC